MTGRSRECLDRCHTHTRHRHWAHWEPAAKHSTPHLQRPTAVQTRHVLFKSVSREILPTPKKLNLLLGILHYDLRDFGEFNVNVLGLVRCAILRNWFNFYLLRFITIRYCCYAFATSNKGCIFNVAHTMIFKLLNNSPVDMNLAGNRIAWILLMPWWSNAMNPLHFKRKLSC